MSMDETMGGAGIEILDRQAARVKKRRSSLWLSVILPFILSVVAVAALVYFVARSPAADPGAWADTSLVFLLLPLLILCLIPLVLAGLLIFGTTKLIAWLPEPLASLESGVRRVNRSLSKGIRVGLKPLIILKALWAAFKSIFTQLLAFVGRGE
jgi:hypothetical protein